LIFFTSDTHFGHKKMAELRGFSQVSNMDEKIIETWNKIIPRTSTVYHLGDFALGDPGYISKIRSRLHGKIHLILGNHDYKNKIHKLSLLFTSLSDLKCVKYNHNLFTLCHYPMRQWPSSHRGSFHLYGHSHGIMPPYGKSFDVGWDRWSRPLPVDEVLQILEKLPDNPDMLLIRGEDYAE